MTASHSKNILLSFVGFHDPFFQGPTDAEEREGPLLSLLRGKDFDAAILVSTPNTEERTQRSIEAIENRFPEAAAAIQHIAISDPTDYFEILTNLRRVLRNIRDIYPDANYFIGTASGTPQMHTCWVLLSASGEFPARLLQTRPPRFVTADKPAINEIDPSNSEFPIVRQKVWEKPIRERSDHAAIIRAVGIIGEHPRFKHALEQACLVGASNEPALILGESGTGKELVAKLIWNVSDRSTRPLISVNCSSIPESLAESILFGHKKGAFTDASDDRQGKFMEANHGTLFLDEIGELPNPVQAKLLRAIELGEVEPVGGSTIKTNVRIIAATNRQLSADSDEGGFRKDLYFRLNVGQIDLPPLRQRSSDIGKLAMSILDKQCQSLKRSKQLNSDAIRKLESYPWPGNVRELQNAIKRAVLVSQGTVITADDIPVQLTGPDSSLQHLPTPQDGFSLKDYLDLVRDSLYDQALELSGGNQSRAKQLLGVSDNAVSKHVKKKRADSGPINLG